MPCVASQRRWCWLLQAFDSLELTEEKIHAITDKIPQKPVTIVEGTSYMVIILGAFAVRSCRAAAATAAAKAKAKAA
jgi:hypothetical protein